MQMERKYYFNQRRVLVVLQNAYDKGGLHKGHNPEKWMHEFLGSRTGARLATMFSRSELPTTDLTKCHYVNTTDEIGFGASSKLPPDPQVVRRALHKLRPDMVVACGQQAEEVVLSLWPHDIVAIPHPAHRLLTNDLLRAAGDVVRRHLTQRDPDRLRVAFRQFQGRHGMIDLPGPAACNCDKAFMLEA